MTFAYPDGVSELETRQLGGVLAVTVVGVGCNNFGRRVDAQGTARVVDAALAWRVCSLGSKSTGQRADSWHKAHS